MYYLASSLATHLLDLLVENWKREAWNIELTLGLVEGWVVVWKVWKEED